MSQAGMTNYITNRIDNVEKWLRRIENTMAFSWIFERKVLLQNIQELEGLEHVEEKILMKTNLMLDHYSYPDGQFYARSDNALNPMAVRFQMFKKKVVKILASIDVFASSSAHRMPFIPFGNDFQFKSASSNFRGMDLVILYVKCNNGKGGFWPNLNAEYCSPTEYFKKLEAKKAVNFSV
jgi:hypothetical protein